MDHAKVFGEFRFNAQLKFPSLFSWFFQTLETSEEFPVCFIQNENGPCGLLASFNASLLAERLLSSGNVVKDVKFSKTEMVGGLTRLINRVAQQQESAVIAHWKNNATDYGVDDLIFTEMAQEEVYSFIEGKFSQYTENGCLILLVYSLYLSSRVKIPESESLVSGIADNLFCEEPLEKIIFLSGLGTLSQYDINNNKIALPNLQTTPSFGLLSQIELSGRILQDAFKTSPSGVFVLHGVNHYTVLFPESLSQPQEEDIPRIFWFFNGLHGGEMKQLTLQLNASLFLEILHPPVREERRIIRPGLGDIDQLFTVDKSEDADDVKKWAFEVLLFNKKRLERYISENEARFEKVDLTVGEKTLIPKESAGKSWYCETCTDPTEWKYARNPPESRVCSTCSQPKEVAGFSFFVNFTDLPESWKTQALNQYTPLLVKMLRTKWPDCDVLQPLLSKIPKV